MSGPPDVWSRGCLVPGGYLVLGVPGLGGAWSGGSGPGLVPGLDPPDGYCCGRYESYWNAFLYNDSFE